MGVHSDMGVNMTFDHDFWVCAEHVVFGYGPETVWRHAQKKHFTPTYELYNPKEMLAQQMNALAPLQQHLGLMGNISDFPIPVPSRLLAWFRCRSW